MAVNPGDEFEWLNRVAIVGVGDTPVGRVPGYSSLAFHQMAIKNAVADAGLSKDDIDAVFTQSPYTDATFMHSVWVAKSMGINLRYSADMNIGGATPVGMLIHAAMAIASGLCSTAVISFGENQLSARKQLRHGRYNHQFEDFEVPYGRAGAPIGYAMAARRHMHEYGTTSEQFGAIAVAMRKHASLNPNSQMHEPFTLADHQESDFIVEPFRLLDCCLVSDGGGAVVLTTSARAKDLKNVPIKILGAASNHPHKGIQGSESLTLTGARFSGPQAFAQAGLTPKDIDLAEIYDCFTYTVLVQLEDLGFCAKGEGGPYVEGGRIELGGELPVNTHGGLLSQAHIDGMLHIVEAVRQLRGECDVRQVQNAEIALVTGNGGELSTHWTAILGRD